MSPGASKFERELTPTQVQSSTWPAISSAICAAMDGDHVRAEALTVDCREVDTAGVLASPRSVAQARSSEE
jgi:hypothetical protein